MIKHNRASTIYNTCCCHCYSHRAIVYLTYEKNARGPRSSTTHRLCVGDILTTMSSSHQQSHHSSSEEKGRGKAAASNEDPIHLLYPSEMCDKLQPTDPENTRERLNDLRSADPRNDEKRRQLKVDQLWGMFNLYFQREDLGLNIRGTARAGYLPGCLTGNDMSEEVWRVAAAFREISESKSTRVGKGHD